MPSQNNFVATSDLFHGISLRGTVVSSSKVRKLPTQILESATYKLDILNAATSLDDLRSPPGNRLETLRGDYKGYHSIPPKEPPGRINGQWRIIFRLMKKRTKDYEKYDYKKLLAI